MPASIPPRLAPSLSARGKLSAWIALFTAIGLLNANHSYLGWVAIGHHTSFLPSLIQELSGAWSACALIPLLLLGLRWIRRRRHRWQLMAFHLLLLLGFSLLHTSLIWALRLTAFPALGLGHYDYGVISWRYLMESPNDVIVYALTACLSWLADHYQAGRERERRAAALESALAEARLEALRLQLNPHFLFNALNAVSAIMYTQPRAADEMLARIAELLRASLRIQTQRHRLLDEWHLLALYLEIQHARFGPKLQVTRELAAGMDELSVPLLVLQPLVENAIEHASGDTHRVAIEASLRDGQLHLSVRNTCHGSGEPHHGHGIGLANIQARLQHLYGDQAGLSLAPTHDGSEVRLWLPARGMA